MEPQFKIFATTLSFVLLNSALICFLNNKPSKDPGTLNGPARAKLAEARHWQAIKLWIEKENNGEGTYRPALQNMRF